MIKPRLSLTGQVQLPSRLPIGILVGVDFADMIARKGYSALSDRPQSPARFGRTNDQSSQHLLGYTLKRHSTTSPSRITYSLPSMQQLASFPGFGFRTHATRSSYAQQSDPR